jgi:hypothetical protein
LILGGHSAGLRPRGTAARGSTQQDAGHVTFLENFIDELQRKIPLNGN